MLAPSHSLANPHSSLSHSSLSQLSSLTLFSLLFPQLPHTSLLSQKQHQQPNSGLHTSSSSSQGALALLPGVDCLGPPRSPLLLRHLRCPLSMRPPQGLYLLPPRYHMSDTYLRILDTSPRISYALATACPIPSPVSPMPSLQHVRYHPTRVYLVGAR
eukprot:30407-Rhodomonas_salina.1